MDRENIKKNLTSILKAHFPKTLDFDENEYFTDTGALTSFDLTSLILHIEQVFTVSIHDGHFSEENLGSIKRITNHLETLLER